MTNEKSAGTAQPRATQPLTSLTIQNYKSLRNVAIRLPELSAFVGANASGKSNLVDSIDFLSRAFEDGLPTAVRSKGGYFNLCFRRRKRSRSEIKFYLTGIVGVEGLGTTLQYSYSFAFKAQSEALTTEYFVTSEQLIIRAWTGVPPEWREWINIHRSSGGGFQVEVGNIPLTAEMASFNTAFKSYTRSGFAIELPKDELFMTSNYLRLPPVGIIRQLLSSIRVYQINPHDTRQIGIPEKAADMSRFGGNLPAAIDYLSREKPQEFERLLHNMKRVVPALHRVETAYLQKGLALYIREQIDPNHRWNVNEVSDGTLQALGLFFALVDDRKSMICIEEPENAVHPWIVRHFINECRRADGRKQILMTTHSPVVVSLFQPNELFVVERPEAETLIASAAQAVPAVGEIMAQGIMSLGQFWEAGRMGGVPRQLDLFSQRRRNPKPRAEDVQED